MTNEYIRRQDAKDALQEKVFHNLTDEFYGAMQVLDELEPADVVQVKHARWEKKMNTRKDCLHYHEEPYMGERVDCCLAETTFGWCPCTPDCENYISKDFYARIVRCKDCLFFTTEKSCCRPEGLIKAREDAFCSYGERREQ